MAKKKVETPAPEPTAPIAGEPAPLYVHGVRVENVMNIELVELEFKPEGGLVEVTGPNGSGKTSLIEAIVMGLGGKHYVPARPVHGAAEEGVLHLDLGEVTVDLVVDPDRETKLKVMSRDGMEPRRAQEYLDKLFDSSGLALDPFDLALRSPDEVAKIMCQLIKLDVTEAKAKRMSLYDARATRNKEVKRLTAQLAGVAPVEVPEERAEHDVTAAMARLSELQAEGMHRSGVEAAARSQRAGVELARKRVTELEAQLAAARKQLTSHEAGLAKLDAELARLPVIDVAAATAEVRRLDAENKTVRAHNAEREAAMRQRSQRESLEVALRTEADAAAALTKQIEEVDADTAKRLAEAAYPVEGLALVETDAGLRLRYRGVPFEQASTSEKIKVTLDVVAALSPRLRWVPVRRGNDLDPENLKVVARWARERGYQVMMERVSTGAKPTGIVLKAGRVELDARGA